MGIPVGTGGRVPDEARDVAGDLGACRRGLNWNCRLTWDIALPVALLGFMLLTRHVFAVITIGEGAGLPMRVVMMVFGIFIPALALMSFSARRWRFALGIAACLLVAAVTESADTIATYRSFFGIYRIVMMEQGHTRLLLHGTTLHGAESLLPGEETLPLTYYSHEGPFGCFFAALPRVRYGVSPWSGWRRARSSATLSPARTGHITRSIHWSSVLRGILTSSNSLRNAATARVLCWAMRG
jgi:hypothetical protein